ncbi:MAG: endonuclease/exonuclease/phosphatase family protein [Gammaproteobacteria bacterium]|nr:endonuclease/exonuclease/phosphatase family protein [Gammaproteobacteria bacterium]
MKIATWSVNSVNRRLPYLRHWLHKRKPDVVALQKVRVSSKRRGNFPRKAIENVGYRVEELFADQELASVAVLVRQGFLQGGRELEVRQRGLPGQEVDGRLLTVDAGRVHVASVYAPYALCGSSNVDEVRRSIQAKVEWLRRLEQCVAGQPFTGKPMFLCGDFNVVLDGESKPDTLNRSPDEREALLSLRTSGFVDLYRDFHGEGRQGFNSGTPITSPPDTRLHLVLGPASVVPDIKSAWVDLEYRGPIDDLPEEKWAPGAPVIVEIDGDSI